MVKGKWMNASEVKGTSDDNILGKTGLLILDVSGNALKIPHVEATEEFLNFYKAHLIEDGECFTLKGTQPDFPIFVMQIGKNYVSKYLMKMSGMYIEHHNEPHFHEPLKKGFSGYYILSRKIGDRFYLTAFTIPYGYSVYSEPGAIHEDATTIGLWRVGYTKANEFSTCTVVNKNKEKIGFVLF
jgi:hypothetical protein